jgi:negative regulator of genetic competence, sporulation and motility
LESKYNNFTIEAQALLQQKKKKKQKRRKTKKEEKPKKKKKKKQKRHITCILRFETLHFFLNYFSLNTLGK